MVATIEKHSEQVQWAKGLLCGDCLAAAPHSLTSELCADCLQLRVAAGKRRQWWQRRLGLVA